MGTEFLSSRIYFLFLNLTRCIFCFEFVVVFLLPSLLGLLDVLGDCELSEPGCPFILGRDTELLRELNTVLNKLCNYHQFNSHSLTVIVWILLPTKVRCRVYILNIK